MGKSKLHGMMNKVDYKDSSSWFVIRVDEIEAWLLVACPMYNFLSIPIALHSQA